MRRLQVIELEDFPWFPKALRDPATDYLRYFSEFLNIYLPAEALLVEALKKSGETSVVDLCSGGGGALISLRGRISQRLNKSIKCVLTDRYPNLSAFEQIKKETNGDVTYVPSSVDATQVPEDLKGVRTIFSALHHFPPELVGAILKDAEKSNSTICIFEATERTVNTTMRIFLVGLGVFILTPFIRPFSFGRLFWTYILPLVPLLVLFDGIMSCLRTYTPEELINITKKFSDPEKYEWRAGKIKHKGILIGVSLTYLVGCPRKQI